MPYALLIALCLPTSPAEDVGFEKSYDRVRDQTLARLRCLYLTAEGKAVQPAFSFVAIVKGERLAGPSSILLSFRFTSDTWRYLKYRDVSCLVDGVRYVPRASYDGDTFAGGVTETILIPIAADQAEQLAGAKDAVVAIGHDTFVIDDQPKAALRLFLDALKDPERLDALGAAVRKVYGVRDAPAGGDARRRPAQAQPADPDEYEPPPLEKKIVDAFRKELAARGKMKTRVEFRTWQFNAYKRIAAKHGVTVEVVIDAIRSTDPTLLTK